jgi:hypothetical protein
MSPLAADTSDGTLVMTQETTRMVELLDPASRCLHAVFEREDHPSGVRQATRGRQRSRSANVS